MNVFRDIDALLRMIAREKEILKFLFTGRKAPSLRPEQALEIIKKVDKMRENYISKYTNSSRYDTHNYDLVIRADGKSEDEIVDFILAYIGK